jgi:osmoprotectant transport system permease protein
MMPRRRAETLGIRSIADLAAHAGSLSIAGDYEFFARPEWAALRQEYGLAFREQRTLQPDFMYAAVSSGEVDVIAGYTSDGRIDQNDLLVLDDPRRAIPPYDAVLLLAPRRQNDARLREALAPLLGRIDIAAMREANRRASGSGATSSVDTVARWLADRIRARNPRP